MKHVDLNVDLAEGCSNDQRLLQLVTSANVACGLHAGDFNEMRKTRCVSVHTLVFRIEKISDAPICSFPMMN